MKRSYDEVVSVEEISQKKNDFQRFNIPKDIQDIYREAGITAFYEWQKDCLANTNVLRGENLVYCAPTSSGKSLIAELSLLKTVIVLRKKVICVFPYVSLVIEKEKSLKRLITSFNRSQPITRRIRISANYGAKKNSKWYRDNVILCTIEKANAMINYLHQKGKFNELGCVIADESHVICNSMNGYILETLMAKILYWNTFTVPCAINLTPIQIIAMSATMGNVNEFASWLKARLYTTSFRPIPLIEYIKAGKDILDKNGNFIKTLESCNSSPEDPDDICALCEEGIANKQSVLVFCPTKAQCKKICKIITMYFSKSERYLNDCSDPIYLTRKAFVEKLCGQNLKTDEVLIESVIQGVAYHNSNLTITEKEEIENGFRTGVITVLVSTTTLAAGVNLPAGRVLIHSMKLGKDDLGIVNYTQMSGRAGRKGQSDSGESYLIVKPHEKAKALALVNQCLPDIISTLGPLQDGGNAILRAVTEAVSIHMCTRFSHIEKFLELTLFSAQLQSMAKEHIQKITSTAIDILEEINIVQRVRVKEMSSLTRPNDFDLEVKQLGKALVKIAMDPNLAFILYESLERARDKLILETPLHLLYLVSPLDHPINPNFQKLRIAFDKSARTKKNVYLVMQAIGLSIEPLCKWAHHPPRRFEDNRSGFHRACESRFRSALSNHENKQEDTYTLSIDDWNLLCKCKRLWAALIMAAILDGYSPEEVSKYYDCQVVDIDNIFLQTRIFLSSVRKLCAELGWSAMDKVFAAFALQLNSGNDKNVAKLLTIPHITPKIATVLVENGITSATDLARESIENVVQYLMLSIGFNLQVPLGAFYCRYMHDLILFHF